MKATCVILLIFVTFFSGKPQDTIPEQKVPVVASYLGNKAVDSIVKNHKNEWYIKERTWVNELRKHIDTLYADNIRRGNERMRVSMELDARLKDIDTLLTKTSILTNERLNLILSNQKLQSEKLDLQKSVQLLTAMPHVAMSFAGSLGGCLIAMGVYRAFLNRKKHRECGKQQKSG